MQIHCNKLLPPPPKKKQTFETLTHANKNITDTLPLTQNWYE